MSKFTDTAVTLDGTSKIPVETTTGKGYTTPELIASKVPVAGLSTLGTVKRNARSAGQFMTGFDAAGNSLFETPPGGAPIFIARTAWVEMTGNDFTGAVGNPALPFLTINAALVALGTSNSTTKIVRIGIGRFEPVSGAIVGTSSGPNYAATSIIYDNTWFVGSGQPRIAANNTTLVDGSGTIIVGPLAADNDGIKILNLGVDCGSAEVTARWEGAAQDAIAVYNQGQVASPGTKAPRKGCHVENVVGLCKDGSASVHACLLENLDGLYANNIVTRYGFAGVVLKVINSRVSNLDGSGHSQGALYIKSNAYAACNNNVISNVVMRQISGSGQGIRFDCADSGAPDLTEIVVHGVMAYGVTTAVNFVSGSVATQKRIRIDALQPVGVGNLYTTSGTINERYTLFINAVSLRTTPTLLNGWQNFGSGNAGAEWWIEDGSLVVEGVISNGSVPSYIFNIPSAARPNTFKRAVIIATPAGTSTFANAVVDGTGLYFESGTMGSGFASIASRFSLP